jgi:hypothetical protein
MYSESVLHTPPGRPLIGAQVNGKPMAEGVVRVDRDGGCHDAASLSPCRIVVASGDTAALPCCLQVRQACGGWCGRWLLLRAGVREVQREEMNDEDKLTLALDALKAWERWEADMILHARDAWWNLQSGAQNDALTQAQGLRNAVLHPGQFPR